MDRLRGNKKTTVIWDFAGSEESLQDLSKDLKKRCGAGGSAKDGEIIIQGDFREKIAAYLHELGYKTKFVGG